MANTTRWQALGVTLAVAAGGPCNPVAATERVVLVVHLDDRARVPPAELTAAKVVVERTFRSAGVEIAWREERLPGSLTRPGAGEDDLGRTGVMLTNNFEPPSPEANRCPLGLAVPELATAYVFYNRSVDVSRTHPVDSTVVLGRVIAHEIGHLLLPAGSHWPYGLMRADLDLSGVNPDRFTDDQARTIRAKLARRSPGQ